MGKYRRRIIALLVMTYMILAFAWWAILLYRENVRIYELQKLVYPLETEEVYRNYTKTRNMIVGESIAFGVSIVIGMFLIYKAFQYELKAQRRQRNFLLSVTHELKTPIASLKLIIRTLRHRKLSPEKKESLLLIAEEESNRLDNHVQNILLTAQLDHNYSFNFERLNISELIKDRIEVFRIQYPDREIRNTIDNNILLDVDKEGIISVINNVIQNAIKYSEDQDPVDIRLTQDDKMCHLEINDFGSGIPDHHKTTVFEKFKRLDNEDTRASKGTGLGLYIVKTIVEAHKGILQLKDNAPKGTSMIIKLPKSG